MKSYLPALALLVVSPLLADPGTYESTANLFLPAVGQVREPEASTGTPVGTLLNENFSKIAAALGFFSEPMTAPEASAAGDLVYVSGDGAVQLSLADDPATAKVDGFIWEKVSPTSARVMFSGKNTELTGLTPGATYYLSAVNPGGVIATAPTAPNLRVMVGVASRTTELQVLPAPRPSAIDADPAGDTVIQLASGGSFKVLQADGTERIVAEDDGPVELSDENGMALAAIESGVFSGTSLDLSGTLYADVAQVDTIANEAGTGATNFSQGLNVATAKTLKASAIQANTGEPLIVKNDAGTNVFQTNTGGSQTISLSGNLYAASGVGQFGLGVQSSSYLNAAGDGAAPLTLGATIPSGRSLSTPTITSPSGSDLRLYAAASRALKLQEDGAGADLFYIDATGNIVLQPTTVARFLSGALWVDYIRDSAGTGAPEMTYGVEVPAGAYVWTPAIRPAVGGTQVQILNDAGASVARTTSSSSSLTLGGALVTSTIRPPTGASLFLADQSGMTKQTFSTTGEVLLSPSNYVGIASGKELWVTTIENAAGTGGPDFTYGFGEIWPAGYTISTGVVTPDKVTSRSRQLVVLDTEGGAATDDLVTIGGGGCRSGAQMLLRTADSSRDVTVVNYPTSTNILLDSSKGNFTLNNVQDWLLLGCYTSSGFWSEVSRSDN